MGLLRNQLRSLEREARVEVISIPQHDGTVKRFPQFEHGIGAPRTRPGLRPRGGPFFLGSGGAVPASTQIGPPTYIPSSSISYGSPSSA
jgi:hypothetical protein